MKFLHTCVRVKDLDKSVEFYEKALDFKVVRKVDFPENKFTLVYMATDENPEFELELTYNYDHPGYDLGNGYGHIAVGVEDLEGLHKKHEEAGYQVTPLSGLPGGPKMFYFIQDPDGYKVEVIKTSEFFTAK